MYGKDIMGIQTAGAECCRSARETSGLATITIAKATELVTFGQELSSTLQDVCRSSSSSSKSGSTTTTRALDASKFATIMDLVDGDKIKASMTLAHELSELSVKCADKSQDMIASMERGVSRFCSRIVELTIMELLFIIGNLYYANRFIFFVIPFMMCVRRSMRYRMRLNPLWKIK